MTWQCKRWGCLPDAGGYYDQEYVLMVDMATVDNIYNFVSKSLDFTYTTN